MYTNGMVSGSARVLKIVPDSTCEAETALASKGSKETVAMRMISEDMDRPVTGPTPLLIDAKATRDVIVNPGATARTRYYERAVMLVKRLYHLLILQPFLITTDKMVADIFTKALPPEPFFRFRDYLLNRSNAPDASHHHADANEVAWTTRGRQVTLRGSAARLWSRLVTQ